MNIAVAALEDIALLAAIEQRAQLHPWTEVQLAGELSLPQSLVQVARVEAEVVGYVVSWLVAGVLEILNVCTAPEWRRRGIARALVKAALERGCESAILEVRRSNAGAIALYESLGFSRTGERRGYYEGGEDAILYTLPTIPAARL